jgi:hypothetical protein
MRKPRDFDSALRALTDKTKALKENKRRQLGELIVAAAEVGRSKARPARHRNPKSYSVSSSGAIGTTQNVGHCAGRLSVSYPYSQIWRTGRCLHFLLLVPGRRS